jgi:hypothetical protein
MSFSFGDVTRARSAEQRTEQKVKSRAKKRKTEQEMKNIARWCARIHWNKR